MKRISEIIKTVLITAGAVTVVFLIFTMIDHSSDGVVLDSLSKYFTYETSYTDAAGKKWACQRIDWTLVKQTALTFTILFVAAVVLLVRRITGRNERQLREELRNKEWELDVENQKKNDLITYLAHDLKTPLTSVIGYLSLLNEAPDLPEELRVKYTKIGLDKAFRLETLINEFFDITRYHLQEIELSREELDLSFLLRQLAEEFYPLLREKNNQIQLDIQDGITILGDPEKLARVFNNILKNAIAYSTPDTVITVKLTAETAVVRAAVSNHGKTIPKEKLERIFDKFYRLDEARSINTGGAGLGLAIARKIVMLHKGTISAESTDGVTTFLVELPRQKGGLTVQAG